MNSNYSFLFLSPTFSKKIGSIDKYKWYSKLCADSRSNSLEYQDKS